jgi:hypothetical protein
VGLFVASVLRTLIFFNICMQASVTLHKLMFSGVLRAPMKFFETNPVGKSRAFIANYPRSWQLPWNVIGALGNYYIAAAHWVYCC